MSEATWLSDFLAPERRVALCMWLMAAVMFPAPGLQRKQKRVVAWLRLLGQESFRPRHIKLNSLEVDQIFIGLVRCVAFTVEKSQGRMHRKDNRTCCTNPTTRVSLDLKTRKSSP